MGRRRTMDRKRMFVLCLLLSTFAMTTAVAKAFSPDYPAEGTKVRVACVGNSVTYGYGLPDREKQAYPVVLQQLLGEKYEVRNFGHSGTTLLRHGHRPYMQQSEYREALDFMPDEVVIHLGLNDTDPRNWPDYADEFVPDYLALIDSFRTANPKAKIWICLMTPISHRHPRFNSGTRDWHEAIQKAIRRTAQSADVGLIDLHTPLYSRPDLFPDALHPNAEGAGIIAKTVYQALSGDYGGLQVPEIYGSGMVIQREMPIRFHGTADAGERVVIDFNGNKTTVKAKDDGQWEVLLPMMSAGGPYPLSFQTSGREIHFDDVWVGDVWLFSGQSNMEFPLDACSTAEEDLAKADSQPLVHIYNMSARYPTNHVEWDSDVLDSVNHLRYLNHRGWQTSSRESVKDFSAIAYHVGRVLADSLQVPVGVICNAVGGTTTESWIDRNFLEHVNSSILHDWYHGDYGQPWARERALKNIAKASSTLQRHPYEPCYMYETGILPLDHYAIMGVAWYQGESNTHNIELHEQLFNLLEMSWRIYFQNPKLPFYVVQLSSLNRPSWPRFRDSQRQLADKAEATWLVVSHDLGDSLDVHFPNKRPLGERIARQMLQHTYFYDLDTDSPVPQVIISNGKRMYITFNRCDSCPEGKEVIGFEVAGRDSVFHDAHAMLIDDMVIMESSEVKTPIYVRYAWQPFTRADFRKDDGMPMSTFCSKSRVVVEPLTGFPDEEKGIEHGVSACYAGVIDDYLIMAGGCNFPDEPAANGGKKHYYRGIYAARLYNGNTLEWKRVGWLPTAAAYGVSVTTTDGVICVGGNNEDTSLRSAFKIRMEDGKAVIDSLPPLPVPLDNFTGAIQNNTLCVFGGRRLYILELDQVEKGWQLLKEYDKELRQPVSGFINNSYCLWGGYTPKTKGKKASLMLDGYEFDGKSLYSLDGPAFPDSKEKVFLGGAAAVNMDAFTLVVMGGVNKDIFLKALNNPDPDYLTHPVEWYEFNPFIFVYFYNHWIPIEASRHVARAGAALVMHHDDLYLVGGEVKPGIRTPSVCRINIERNIK